MPHGPKRLKKQKSRPNLKGDSAGNHLQLKRARLQRRFFLACVRKEWRRGGLEGDLGPHLVNQWP